MQRIAEQHSRQASNDGYQRGLIHVSPGEMLSANRVIQLVPKISVASVPQEMNGASRNGKTNRDDLLRFKPIPAKQADLARGLKRACFLLHNGLPLSQSNEIHDLNLPWSKVESIGQD